MKLHLTIHVPNWLDLICVSPLLACRRLRFGYPFRRIPLTQGYFAIVDPADYYDLSKFKWRVCKNKHKNTLYAERSIRKNLAPQFIEGLFKVACRRRVRWSRLLMHKQLIPVVPPGLLIDHENGDGLDNRRANLRLATPAENAWNTRPRKSLAGCKGVSFCKDKNRFRASIMVHGKSHHLGYFKSPLDAALAYNNAAKKYFGKFARLNNVW